MDIRFYNAKILTMERGSEIIEGELWVRGNRITHVGSSEPCRIHWEREINAGGNLLIPGFKNAHTHSAMTFLRSYADDMPLHDWLNNQVFPMEAKLTPEDIYHLSRLAILEYLTSGMTANFDMYFHPGEIVRASVDMGFRTVLVPPIMAWRGSPQQAEEEFIRFNSHHELISSILGFHAEYTASDEMLENLAYAARKHKSPVFAHNSETRTEVEGCIERHGTTPTVYMDKMGLFEYGGGGFHCVHVSEEDMDVMRARKLWAVTSPASNLKLASGVAPLQRMLSAGIGLAIGTDGAASNNCLDMFREMFLATALQKLILNDASAMDARAVLEMATADGARAMGLHDCDALTPGKLADIVMIDLHRPNMQPENNITKNLIYSGSKENVAMTMVNGKILYEAGRFYVGADPEEIYAKANEIIAAKR